MLFVTAVGGAEDAGLDFGSDAEARRVTGERLDQRAPGGAVKRQAHGGEGGGGYIGQPAGGVRGEIGAVGGTLGGKIQVDRGLDLVTYYGQSIVQITDAVRANVINRIEGMTGLQVTEINITVDDLYVEGQDDDQQEQQEPRVR